MDLSNATHQDVEQTQAHDYLRLRRVAAYLCDVVLLFVVLAPAGLLIQRLVGIVPRSGIQIWFTVLWNFSIPTWLYFIAMDSSRSAGTFGKRLLKLQVVTWDGERLGLCRGLARTAAKLLPWELAHFSAFALSARSDEMAVTQIPGLVVANTLAIVYLGFILANGQRGPHDFMVGTHVVPTRTRGPVTESCQGLSGTEQ